MATLVELSPTDCVVAVVAVLIVPFKSPANVVALTVPAPEISLAPMAMSPLMVPPARSSFDDNSS